MVRQLSPASERRGQESGSQSEDIFANINTCLCGFFDFFLQEDVVEKTKANIIESKMDKFKDLLQKNNVTEVYFNHNNVVSEIKYGSSIVYRDLTKDLVNFIKKEYKDDPNVIKALNQLPKIGNKIQDKKLIKIAYKLVKDAEQKHAYFYSTIGIQSEEAEKNVLKKEIISMNSTKDNNDPFEQINRELNDFAISATELLFCCARKRDSNPKTVINVLSSSQENSSRAR